MPLGLGQRYAHNAFRQPVSDLARFNFAPPPATQALAPFYNPFAPGGNFRNLTQPIQTRADQQAGLATGGGPLPPAAPPAPVMNQGSNFGNPRLNQGPLNAAAQAGRNFFMRLFGPRFSPNQFHATATQWTPPVIPTQPTSGQHELLKYLMAMGRQPSGRLTGGYSAPMYK